MTARICVVLLVARAAAAEPSPERCAAGAKFAAQGDLPRAALYLDGCDDAAERAVKHELEASQLSELSIVSDPPGVVAEVDALPGEQLVTPATVWVRAGHHEVKAASGTAAVDVKPHSRATIVLEVPKPAAAPGTGHVDFNEDNAGEVSGTAPPPPVKHPPMLECKFTKTCAPSAVQLDDPLALHEEPPPRYPLAAIDVRAGMTWYSGHIEPSAAIDVGAKLAGRDFPLVGELRGDWSRRVGANEWGATASLAQVVLANQTTWLALGAGGKYSSFDGWEPVTLAEVALRWLPVTFGMRYEWTHAAVIEVGARY